MFVCLLIVSYFSEINISHFIETFLGEDQIYLNYNLQVILVILTKLSEMLFRKLHKFKNLLYPSLLMMIKNCNLNHNDFTLSSIIDTTNPDSLKFIMKCSCNTTIK